MQKTDNAVEKKYMAFISYSHADNREDGRKWADWLHHALETYEVPADLVGKKNSVGEVIPNQIYPVFQDEKELSASSSLDGALKAALDNTQTLIYLSSPRSARSSYVRNELRYFKQRGGADRMIALIVGGEPEYVEGEGSDRQCFPPELRYRVDSSGNITNEREEPLAADVRLPEDDAEGYTSAEAYRRHLVHGHTGLSGKEVAERTESYKNRLELAKLKIIAGVLRVPLGELTKRDKAYQLEKIKRKNRNIKRIATAIGVLALAAICMGIYAWVQRNNAVKTFAGSLFASGVEKANRGEMTDAGAYMAEAARSGDKRAQLFGASMLTTQGAEYVIPGADGSKEKVFNRAGTMLTTLTTTGNDRYFLQVWDVRRNAMKYALPQVPVLITGRLRYTDDGSIFFTDTRSRLWRWQPEKHLAEVICGDKPGHGVSQFAVSNGGDKIAVLYANNAYEIIDTDRRSIWLPETKASADLPVMKFIFGETGSALAVIDEGSTFSKHAPAVGLYYLGNDGIKGRHFVFAENMPAVSFNSNGTRAAVYGANTVAVMDIVNDAAPRMIPAGTVRSVWFNPDGNTLVINGTGSQLVNFADGSILKQTAANPALEEITNYANADAYSMDYSTRLVNVNNKLSVRNEAGSALLLAKLAMPGTVKQAVAGPGTKVFIYNAVDNKVQAWDVESEKLNDFVTVKKPIARIGYLRKADLLYVITADNTVDFYNSTTGKQRGGSIRVANNKIPLATNYDEDKLWTKEGAEISIYSLPEGKREEQLIGLKFQNYMISPDVKFAFLRQGPQAWTLVGLPGGKEITAGKGNVTGVRFSNDGRSLLVMYAAGTTELRETSSGKVRFKFKAIENATGDFSNDGNTFALSEDAYTVRLWSVKDGSPVGQAIPAATDARYFRFSADGTKVYTYGTQAGNFSTVLNIYDTATGYPLSMPAAMGEAFFAETFGDEKHLLTLDRKDGRVVASVWEMPGRLDMPAAELANDLERFYGKKYDKKTATLVGVAAGGRDSDRWYFKNVYSRSKTPGSNATAMGSIKALLPLKSEASRALLSQNYLYHPLAKAAMAEYYSRKPETAYLADYFYKRAALQLKNMGAKQPEAEKYMQQAAARIYREARP